MITLHSSYRKTAPFSYIVRRGKTVLKVTGRKVDALWAAEHKSKARSVCVVRVDNRRIASVPMTGSKMIACYRNGVKVARR